MAGASRCEGSRVSQRSNNGRCSRQLRLRLARRVARPAWLRLVTQLRARAAGWSNHKPTGPQRPCLKRAIPAVQCLQQEGQNKTEFLRKCAKKYTSTISVAELDVYATNMEQHNVAGSRILTFSDSQRNVLIPCFGFGNFLRKELRTQVKICLRESDLHFGTLVDMEAEQTSFEGYANKTYHDVQVSTIGHAACR